MCSRQQHGTLGPCKENFDCPVFCSSKYENSNSNLLSRLVNSFAFGLNSKPFPPTAIIVILHDDMIQYLNYEKYGISSMYGDMLDWVATQLEEIINTRINQLPVKAKLQFLPQFYWLTTPFHVSWDNIQTRLKYNNTLELVMKLYDNMRVIKFKDNWDVKDKDLVQFSSLSVKGFRQFWLAMDVSVKFNLQKCKEYLIVEQYKKLIADRNSAKTPRKTDSKLQEEDTDEERNDSAQKKHRRQNKMLGQQDPMQKIFRRHNKQGRNGSRSHWQRTNNKFNRFALPKPSNI